MVYQVLWVHQVLESAGPLLRDFAITVELTEEDIEAQSGEVTCLRSDSKSRLSPTLLTATTGQMGKWAALPASPCTAAA